MRLDEKLSPRKRVPLEKRSKGRVLGRSNVVEIGATRRDGQSSSDGLAKEVGELCEVK